MATSGQLPVSCHHQCTTSTFFAHGGLRSCLHSRTVDLRAGGRSGPQLHGGIRVSHQQRTEAPFFFPDISRGTASVPPVDAGEVQRADSLTNIKAAGELNVQYLRAHATVVCFARRVEKLVIPAF